MPEGSYSTDPNTTARIIEYREMVQALNENGLRVVMDVVYNHTNAGGQSEKSVLDRIVRLLSPPRCQWRDCQLNVLRQYGHRARHDAQIDD